MVLMLVGLGLDRGDISVRALDALKKASRIYFERYTSTISQDYLDFIKAEIGRQRAITEISRSDLEEKSGRLVDEAVSNDIAIMVPGDPLVATTHQIVLEAAEKRGAGVIVYHAASVFTAAIGESGLDIYKFGPTTTIPFWHDNYRPISFIDVINKNMERGNHTMVLVDYDSTGASSMSLREAIDRLLFAEKERGYKILGSRKVLAIFDIGRPSQNIVLADLASLSAMHAKDDKGRLLTIIIPAEPSFAEEELMSRHGHRPA